MVQPSNKPNEHVLAALMAALEGPPKPSPRDSVLAALFYNPPPKPTSQPVNLLAIAQALTPKPKPLPVPNIFALGASRSQVGNGVGVRPPTLPKSYLGMGTVSASPSWRTSHALADAFLPTLPGPPGPALNFLSLVGSATSAPFLPATKRNVFYSFHYDDIIRVNNVRHTEQFKAKILEVPQSHYDRSLWETSKRTNPESLKGLIRDGVKDTSVVCVLIGTHTFARPWVRYEIARSVIDQKGLLAVEINSINHHRDRAPHPPGPNPLTFMAVSYMADGTYRLFEKNIRLINGRWQWVWERYSDHLAAVPLPKYLHAMGLGYLQTLNQGTVCYDAVRNDVWRNMAGWLNAAAIAAGRK